MRLPRDLTGRDLIRLLEKLGYRPTRQAGSLPSAVPPAPTLLDSPAAWPFPW